MTCQHCGKPAMFLVGPEQNVPVCLDCNLKIVQMNAIQAEQLERELNYLSGEMEAIVGLPEFLPRYPERRPVQVTRPTFNQIRVSNSSIGILNTGNIETVSAAVTAISGSGDEALATAIRELRDAIVSDGALNPEAKDKLLEVLGVVSTEATAPKERRKKFAIRPLLRELGDLARDSASLFDAWNRLRALIEAAFT